MCVAQFPNKWLSLADCIDCLFCCQDGLRPSFVYPTSGMIQNIFLFPTFFNLTNVKLNIYEVYFLQLNLELRSWDLCLIIVLAITFPKYLEFAAVGNILFYLCSKSSSLQLSLELGNALTVDKRLMALYCSVRRNHGQQQTTTCGGASHSGPGKWTKCFIQGGLELPQGKT